MSGYKIIEKIQIDPHVIFLRIETLDIKITLRYIFDSLSDLSWISKFDKDYIKASFEQKAKSSIKYIAEKIINGDSDKVTSNSGEYVVSELARNAIVDELEYLDIPLAELFKIKDVGNHGFDLYSINKKKIILFGEAKYSSQRNAYGNSLKQIVRFERDEKQDVADITDIEKFCCIESLENFSDGKKGFIAAFSSKKTDTKDLIEGIKENCDYKELVKFNEIICVAVNL